MDNKVLLDVVRQIGILMIDGKWKKSSAKERIRIWPCKKWSCMTWMTLRIITILLDAEGSFYVDTQPLYTRTNTFAQV